MSDVKTIFEQQIHQQIQANAEKVKSGVAAIYLFKITGDGGGSWTVNLKDDVGVKAGEHGTPDCTLEMAAADWLTVRSNPSAAMQLFFQGKIKVAGNMALATKLQQILG